MSAVAGDEAATTRRRATVTDMHDLVRQTQDILRVNGARWRSISMLDPELLRRRPEPGEWSALECLGHAVDGEPLVFAGRVRALLDGAAELRSYDPDTDSTPVTAATDPIALGQRHAELRALSLGLLDQVTDPDLERSSRHTELGTVTLRELLNEWSAHDLMHLVQAERALMQAFIPGTGPWRFYFADHDVEAPSLATAAD